MNFTKSLFISTLPFVGLAIAIYTGHQLFRIGFSLEWLGAFFSGFGIALFFTLVFLNKKPRTSAKLPFYSGMIMLGVAIAAVGHYTSGSEDLTPIVLAIIADASWMLYILWYSKFPNRNEDILQVNNLLPSFSLENYSGESIDSDQFKGSPSIFLFYRGNWCPLCMAQIKEIAGQYKELESRGVNTILVSPQPHKYSASLARKFDVGFNFLVDKGNKVAKRLGIFADNGLPFGMQVFGYDSDTVMPTIVIADAAGKIVFVDLTDNYRVRPEPSTFLKVIDGLK